MYALEGGGGEEFKSLRVQGPSVVQRAVKEELDVKFLLEEIGAALGITKIFGNVATGLYLKSDGSALKGGVQVEDALAVGMVQPLGDAGDGSETARDAFVGVVEVGIGRVMVIGDGFTVMVADDRGDDVAVAPLEARNIAVEGKILAVLVVAVMTDAMTYVVEKRACFQLDARLDRQMVNRLELVEEHEAEFADMFGVALIVLQPAAETARGDQ